MNATKKARKPRPKRSTRAERYPGQAPGPGGHTGFAVRGCGCWLCERHRREESREQLDRALAVRFENEPMVEGSVRVAANATAELVAAMRGRQR